MSKCELTYQLSKVGDFDTFPDAFTKLYHMLTKDLEKGTSYQMIETTIWIHPEGWPTPIPFYEARDIACWMGLLKDGELNPDFVDPMKKEKKNKPLVEGQLQGGSRVVTCPQCKSENVHAVEFFDYVKQCDDCGEQFSTGIHN